MSHDALNNLTSLTNPLDYLITFACSDTCQVPRQVFHSDVVNGTLVTSNQPCWIAFTTASVQLSAARGRARHSYLNTSHWSFRP